MEMNKLLIVHKINDENDRPALERWFTRYHVPEVLVQSPWMVRYLLYRVVPAPPGGEAYGYYNYRVHENWALDNSMRRGMKGILSMTPQPGACDAVIANIPAEPTDDFLGGGNTFDSHTILRWVTVFRYPDGVSFEEGEDWYLNVHVPEVKKQPGLHRFFSYKVNQLDGPPLPKGNEEDDFAEHEDLFFKQWHRVSEMWYDNNNGWVDSIIKNPPAYTKPTWATHDSYPFLIPGKEFISTFLLESPEHDFVREKFQLYY
ncbi:hypothetical protein LQZ18_09825 [Lachnospiraceae bacterium ZAX-1]